MSSILDFVVVAIIGIFSFLFSFALMGIGVDGSLAAILGFLSCLILWLWYGGFLNRRGGKLLPRYEEWKKIAAEMGLEELNNPPQVEGYYRNHHVEILGDPRSGVVDESDPRPLKTLYIIEFENPNAVQIYLKKRLSLAVMLHGHDSIMSYVLKNVKIGDHEFDQRFLTKQNKESDVKAILDQSIRNKILNVKNFNEAEIGFMAFLSDKNNQSSMPIWVNSIWWPPRWSFVEKDSLSNDEAHYIDDKTLNGTKSDAVRFQAIIDTMIDIVEKIEAYTSTI